MYFFRFVRPTQKIAWDGPKWGREVLFPANPDLAREAPPLGLSVFFGTKIFGTPQLVGTLPQALLFSQKNSPQISGNLEIWEAENLEIWDPKNPQKILKIKIRVAQNDARSGLAGKRTSRPHLGPSQAIFCVGRKIQKLQTKIAYFPWWANGPYSTALGQWLLGMPQKQVRRASEQRALLHTSGRFGAMS